MLVDNIQSNIHPYYKEADIFSNFNHSTQKNAHSSSSGDEQDKMTRVPVVVKGGDHIGEELHFLIVTVLTDSFQVGIVLGMNWIFGNQMLYKDKIIMKLKGHVLKINKDEYTLKDQLTEGGFSTIYSTNKPEAICKVQVISQANIARAFNNQKNSLKNLTHSNIVKLYGCTQQKIGSIEYGFLVLQNCNRGTALTALEQEPSFMPQKTILRIILEAAQAVSYMHSKGIAHRDIKLENVLCSQSGAYKLCDFGSSSSEVIKDINKENRANIEQFIEKTTTPLYRCPQQLDLYSGFEIGPQVDVFALGVMIFMLCFKKQPFETRLSAINNQYFLPSEHPYSQDLLRIMEGCFIANPKQRATASLLCQRIRCLMQKKKAQIDFNYERQLEITLDEIRRVNEKTFKKTEQAESSLFDKIRRIYNQMTTQTEGWIVGFIEDNEEPPNLKFNRSIISKCWEKRYKIEKFYQILWRQSEEAKSKCLVTLKLLTLLHNFLRKGPAEGLAFDSPYSPIKLCSKIYNHWKLQQKSVHPEDIKRNTYVVLLIRLYCLIVIGKVKLCFENSDIFEGNYSIVPFLCSEGDPTILKIPLLESMLDFLESCAQFHEVLQKHSYLIDIQRTMILSIVDQSYCLVSTLTFVFCAFKHAVSYVQEDLDLDRLKLKIQEMQGKLKRIYLKLHELFKQTAKLASLFQHNQFQLPLNVISHIENIKLQNLRKEGLFKISQYLNYKDSICGLKIPLTYEEVVKNPTFLKDIESKKESKEYIEINQYKTQKNLRSQDFLPEPDKKVETLKKLSNQPDFKKKSESSSNFSSFTFDVKSDAEKTKEMEYHSNITSKLKDKDVFNTMEFTHQNLNKDFLTADVAKSTKDQFADFMSIVDEKYDEEKKYNMKKDKKCPQFTPTQNISSQNGSGKADKINKIELINFFDDDEDEPKKPEIAQQKAPETQKISQQQKLNEERKQMISQIKEVNISEQTFRSDSFIDLKGFIVEEVKKSAQQYIIEYSALRFKKKIGFGHSSEVFKGEWRGREVAIKKIKDDISSPNAQKEFKREIMTSVKIRHHPQLVTLIGVAQHDNYYYIINQYCQGATLFDILHESQVPLPWRTRVSIAKQIAKGMVFLHTNEPPIIHRDLKSLKYIFLQISVLLVNKYSDKHPDSMQIKIADFGLSRDFGSTYMTGALGTYHWMAPEIFNNEPYTLKADVYSFAIVLWEIIARKPPYLNMKNTQALMKFVTVENGRPQLNQLPVDTPKQLIQLMMKCWDRYPENRPSFTQILDYLSALPIF